MSNILNNRGSMMKYDSRTFTSLNDAMDFYYSLEGSRYHATRPQSMTYRMSTGELYNYYIVCIIEYPEAN